MYKLILFFLMIFASAFGQIRSIVFDYGGVLVNFDSKPLITLFEETFHISSEIAIHLLKSDEWTNHTLPENWDELFHRAIVDGTHEIPGMFDLVSQLKQSGYPVALFSNITAGAAFHIEKMGHYQHFDPVFLSCQMGFEKPEPESYALFLQEMPYEANEIVFIDDRKENVDAANAHGICALHFTSLTQLITDLRELNIMSYTTETRKPITLMGLEKHIENHEGIQEHWNHFFQCMDQIPHKASHEMYGLYTNYEGDHTKPYSLICACPVTQIDTIPEGFQVFEIPANQYAHFFSQGESADHIFSTWQKIWQTDLPRSYTFDYEVYGKDFSQVDIYIAID